jgi:PAS domain S-box-containing protein
MLTNVEPLFDQNGEIIGAVKCFQDITPQKENERRIRQGARAMRTLVDALPAAIYTTDAEGRINFYNKSAAALWGREPALNEDMWCGAHRLLRIDGSELPHEECPMAVTLKTREPVRNVEAIVERPDGSRVPVIPFPTPLFNAEGELVAGINMLVDITERKKFDERQKVLIDELNHRVKNTLATVQAMAIQSFRRNDGDREEVDAFLSRLLALSRTHDHLTRQHWEAADLRAVAEDVLRPLSDRPSGGVSIEGASMRIAPRAALTLGLVLNELATNAAKYGSLSAPEGKLDVSWRVVGDEFILEWRESGGPTVENVTRRGFGTRMIERGVEAELDGNAHLRFEPTGFQCDIRVPRASLT